MIRRELGFWLFFLVSLAICLVLRQLGIVQAQ